MQNEINPKDSIFFLQPKFKRPCNKLKIDSIHTWLYLACEINTFKSLNCIPKVLFLLRLEKSSCFTLSSFFLLFSSDSQVNPSFYPCPPNQNNKFCLLFISNETYTPSPKTFYRLSPAKKKLFISKKIIYKSKPHWIQAISFLK